MLITDSAVQEMKDRQDLRDLMAAYFHALDRHDWDLMGTVFTPDATFDYSLPDGSAVRESGSDNIIDFLKRTRHSKVTMHFMGNQFVEFSGDTAALETYVLVNNIIEQGPAKDEYHAMNGIRYLDTVVRLDGQWRVRNRVMVADWGRYDPVTHRPT